MTPRPGRPDEDAELVDLWQACGLTRPWNDPLDDIRRCRVAPCSELFVLSESPDSGRVFASVMAGGDGHRGWLYYLAVAPAYRGRGHGRALVRHAERWLAGQDLPKAMLMVRDGNEPVRDFYAALGYHEEPRLVLARWLDGRPPPPG